MGKNKGKMRISDWFGHVFSNETKVQIGPEKRIYVWRRIDEKDRPHLVQKKPRSKTLFVMMWGSITSKGKGILLPVEGTLNSQKYC